MKIQFTPKLKQIASTLLVTLVICTILGVSMASYLMLIAQQNALSVRSQTWNLAIAYVEAGIEEGLQQLNSNHENLAVDGWTQDPANVFTRTRTLPGGQYTVTIFFTNANSPAIIARSTVNVGQLQARHLPMAFFAQANGVEQMATVGRAVRVLCHRGTLFTKAMVARDTIDLNGNNIQTDSYDSDDPMRSNNGRWDPSIPIGDKGDVASNASIINAVDVGNANIYGRVSTGPGGTVYVGPNGRIGPVGWNGTGIYEDADGVSWVDDTSNFTFPDTTLPANYASYPDLPPGKTVLVPYPIPMTSDTLPEPPPASYTTGTVTETSKVFPAEGTYIGPVTTNIVTKGPPADRGTWYTYQKIIYSWNDTGYKTNYYDHVIEVGGSYKASSLDGKKVLVQAPGVTLVLPNGLTIGNHELVEIASGANLTIYAGGTTCSINGNGVLNADGKPANLILKCANTVTSFSLNGNAAFCGVLIGPEIFLQMNGGGNDTVDFIGSVMVKKVKMNGHFRFHYDEALGRMPADGRYLITQWDEIP